MIRSYLYRVYFVFVILLINQAVAISVIVFSLYGTYILYRFIISKNEIEDPVIRTIGQTL